MRPVTLMQGLSDLTVCEGDIAQLEVRFSQENVEGTWSKNGHPISATDRIHIVIDKLVHKLLVENATKDDAGSYSFDVPAHGISTTGKLTVQSKLLPIGPLVIFCQIEFHIPHWVLRNFLKCFCSLLPFLTPLFCLWKNARKKGSERLVLLLLPLLFKIKN